MNTCNVYDYSYFVTIATKYEKKSNISHNANQEILNTFVSLSLRKSGSIPKFFMVYSYIFFWLHWTSLSLKLYMRFFLLSILLLLLISIVNYLLFEQEARNLSRVVLPNDTENVHSFSGFLTVDEKFKSNMFFWFFPAKVLIINISIR